MVYHTTPETISPEFWFWYGIGCILTFVVWGLFSLYTNREITGRGLFTLILMSCLSYTYTVILVGVAAWVFIEQTFFSECSGRTLLKL